MKKFQVFYDYECPYCKKGYETLMDLLPAYPETEVEWRPIESHPRPEFSSPHTDLCIQSFYIARELGTDLAKFHTIMYQAVSAERQNVEEPRVLAKILQGILDKDKFLNLLNSGKYAGKVAENNDLAYEKEGIWYVPSFRAGDLKLDARGGVGVTRQELKNFLDKATAGNIV